MLVSLLAFLCWQVSHTVAQDPPTLDNVNYGSFTQGASYSIANQLGIFTAYGLNVTYLQVPNSTFGYAQIQNGGYDILTGTIDNAVNLRFNQGRDVTVLGLLDAGPDLTIGSVPGITSILDLKNKTLTVDSATSGYAYLLRKILSLYGLRLENNDYAFQVVGSTNIRYAALLNGSYNGVPSSATILTYPFTSEGQSLPEGQKLNTLARAADFVNPFASVAFTASPVQLGDANKTALVTRFLSAMYDANRYLASTATSGDSQCAVQAIAQQLSITTDVAELEYAAATDPITGEISTGQLGNFTVDRIGLLNVIDLRSQFGGFANASASFDYADGIVPGPGKLIDYSVLENAIASSKAVQPNCTG